MLTSPEISNNINRQKNRNICDIRLLVEREIGDSSKIFNTYLNDYDIQRKHHIPDKKRIQTSVQHH